MIQRIQMVASALSQMLNVMTARDLTKTGPNESVSARMHRQVERPCCAPKLPLWRLRSGQFLRGW